MGIKADAVEIAGILAGWYNINVLIRSYFYEKLSKNVLQILRRSDPVFY